MKINQERILVHAGFIDWSLAQQDLSSKQENLPPELVRVEESQREVPQKRRALVVDDVSDVTEMLSVLLAHAGYDVTTASSAAAALASARKEQFDVVISDIGMPEMNGYELAKAIRTIPGYEVTPMVAVTGYSMFNDREQSIKSGFTAHMTKPIDPGALLDLIEQL
jgi:CheY-like chemotaxis protein